MLFKSFKKFTAVFLLSAVFFAGCSVSGFFDPNRLSPGVFNNRFVDVVNVLMEEAQTLQENYQTFVPSELTEETKVDTTALDVFYKEMLALKEKSADLTALKSQNQNQEIKVIAEFVGYIDALDVYLSTYNEMILFYSAEDFKFVSEEIVEIDAALKDVYQAYMNKHNEFVEVLDSFK